MRIAAGNVRSRAVLTRLLIKAERHPACSRALGIEDASYFRSEAACEKERGTELC